MVLGLASWGAADTVAYIISNPQESIVTASALVYSSSSPRPRATPSRPSAAAAMRDIAARSAAQRRIAEGIAREDPAYGVRVCMCPCRRCIPSKDDCGSCLYGAGCQLTFLSHDRAASFYAAYGLRYSPRTRTVVY